MELNSNREDSPVKAKFLHESKFPIMNDTDTPEIIMNCKGKFKQNLDVFVTFVPIVYNRFNQFIMLRRQRHK